MRPLMCIRATSRDTKHGAAEANSRLYPPGSIPLADSLASPTPRPPPTIVTAACNLLNAIENNSATRLRTSKKAKDLAKVLGCEVIV